MASTAPPTLSPISNSSLIALPPTGTLANVSGSLPFGMYTDADFISGAVDQVSYVYRKLGGEILDIELTANQVYASYEEAVLEYSYMVNVHQSKNVLSDVLGHTTGTFDSDGELQAGDYKSALSGTGAELRYPRFNFSYPRRIAAGLSEQAQVGGEKRFFSCSVDIIENEQNYDLQQVVSASTDSSFTFDKNTKIHIQKVYYKSPQAMWRFYGYYGGLNIIGNLTTYGQYADDSTFQVIPVWQNKLQAMAYEDSLYTRISHYSYEIRDNRLKLFPIPTRYQFDKVWFEFTVEQDPFLDDPKSKTGVEGINNMNTLPFANIQYTSINSIGKQWIRRFALSLSKEMLGLTRSKFATIPIPGESVTLNGDALITQAKEEMTALRDELKTVLDELTYNQLAEKDAQLVEQTQNLQARIPLAIYVG